MEVDRHQFNERVNKLWEAHTVLMDSQNHAWEAIRLLASNVDKLSIKVDKLSDTVDRLVQGLQKPNGQG